MQVQQYRVVDTETKQHTNKLKYDGCFERVPIKPEIPLVVFRYEHRQIRIEYLFVYQLEVLFLHSTFIMSLLSNKRYLEGFLHATFRLGQFSH